MFAYKLQHFINGYQDGLLHYQFILMIITIFLLTVSLLVALVFLGAYLWSIKNGQFDDDYAPAHRIFFEDNKKQKQTKK